MSSVEPAAKPVATSTAAPVATEFRQIPKWYDWSTEARKKIGKFDKNLPLAPAATKEPVAEKTITSGVAPTAEPTAEKTSGYFNFKISNPLNLFKGKELTAEEKAEVEAKKAEADKNAKIDAIKAKCKKAIVSEIKTLVDGYFYGASSKAFNTVTERSVTSQGTQTRETKKVDTSKEGKIDQLLTKAVAEIVVRNAALSEEPVTEQEKLEQALAKLTSKTLVEEVTTYINDHTKPVYSRTKSFFEAGKLFSVKAALTSRAPAVLQDLQGDLTTALDKYITAAKKVDEAKAEEGKAYPKAEEEMAKKVAALQGKLTGTPLLSLKDRDTELAKIVTTTLKDKKLDVKKFEAQAMNFVNGKFDLLLQEIESKLLDEPAQLSLDLAEASTAYQASSKAFTASGYKDMNELKTLNEKCNFLETQFKTAKALFVQNGSTKAEELTWINPIDSAEDIKKMKETFFEEIKTKRTAARKELAFDKNAFDKAVEIGVKNAPKIAELKRAQAINATLKEGEEKKIEPTLISLNNPVVNNTNVEETTVKEPKERNSFAQALDTTQAFVSKYMPTLSMPEITTAKVVIGSVVTLGLLAGVVYTNPAYYAAAKTLADQYLPESLTGAAAATKKLADEAAKKLADEAAKKLAAKAAVEESASSFFSSKLVTDASTFVTDTVTPAAKAAVEESASSFFSSKLVTDASTFVTDTVTPAAKTVGITTGIGSVLGVVGQVGYNWKTAEPVRGPGVEQQDPNNNNQPVMVPGPVRARTPREKLGVTVAGTPTAAKVGAGAGLVAGISQATGFPVLNAAYNWFFKS